MRGRLKKKTPDPDDYEMEMRFSDMNLSMAWGGSGMLITTRPARYLLRDEVDELKKTVGEQAVDPMSAIEQTTSNFSNRKIVGYIDTDNTRREHLEATEAVPVGFRVLDPLPALRRQTDSLLGEREVRGGPRSAGRREHGFLRMRILPQGHL